MALTKVSIVLTVNDTARIIISTDKNSVLSFNKMEKNAKSGFTLISNEIAIIPLIPIKNTIGIIITKDIQRLLFNTLLSFAAKTLCQFPWWKRFVAATAIKKCQSCGIVWNIFTT